MLHVLLIGMKKMHTTVCLSPPYPKRAERISCGGWTIFLVFFGRVALDKTDVAPDLRYGRHAASPRFAARNTLKPDDHSKPQRLTEGRTWFNIPKMVVTSIVASTRMISANTCCRADSAASPPVPSKKASPFYAPYPENKCLSRFTCEKIPPLLLHRPPHVYGADPAPME